MIEFEDNVSEVTLPRKIPQFPSGTKFVKVVCGGLHTLALTADGLVFSWGCNDDGALGRSGPEALPGVVTVGLKILASDICAGDSHSIAYNSSVGAVFMWGVYRSQEHGNKMDVVRHPQEVGRTAFRRMHIQKVVSGAHHTLFLVNGRVFAAADCDNINLGPGKIVKCSRDVEVTLIDRSKTRNVDVFAGGSHSFMLKENGVLLAWGKNNCGQLGIGNCEDTNVPTRVLKLRGERVKSISGGEAHTVALMDSGCVYSWGINDNSQLGADDETIKEMDAECAAKKWTEHSWPIPRRVKGLEGIARISTGAHYTYAIDGLRSIYSWYRMRTRGRVGDWARTTCWGPGRIRA